MNKLNGSDRSRNVCKIPNIDTTNASRHAIFVLFRKPKPAIRDAMPARAYGSPTAVRRELEKLLTPELVEVEVRVVEFVTVVRVVFVV